jgi:hypothetical protein
MDNDLEMIDCNDHDDVMNAGNCVNAKLSHVSAHDKLNGNGVVATNVGVPHLYTQDTVGVPHMPTHSINDASLMNKRPKSVAKAVASVMAFVSNYQQKADYVLAAMSSRDGKSGVSNPVQYSKAHKPQDTNHDYFIPMSSDAMTFWANETKEFRAQAITVNKGHIVIKHLKKQRLQNSCTGHHTLFTPKANMVKESLQFFMAEKSKDLANITAVFCVPLDRVH